MRLRAELIPTIPAPARVVARNVVWAYGRATSGARPLPDFLIIGPQRTGTTWLHAHLRFHPQIFLSEPKELYFFSSLEQRDPSFVPSCPGSVTFSSRPLFVSAGIS